MLTFEKSVYEWKQPKEFLKSEMRWGMRRLNRSPLFFYVMLSLMAFLMLLWYVNKHILDKPEAPSFGVALILSVVLMCFCLYGQPYLYYLGCCWGDFKVSLKRRGIFIERVTRPTLILYPDLEAYWFEEIAGYHLVKFKLKKGETVQVPVPDVETQYKITRHLTERYGPPLPHSPPELPSSGVGLTGFG